ncbi:MAG: adaptor protein MecA [Lachnospiraceae bacterium]|nr:adaptor protein MecA [Lachnospiraceae bacterium]
MKIEKVNDNQIRCTLTREDLDDRQLKLSELAYGSEKAKTLFRDMMQQANYEFGFEADDIPLMIEAIPLSQDTILLIITKVDYPEELDTRFSRFSEPDESEYPDLDENRHPSTVSAEDILNFFQEIRGQHKTSDTSQQEQHTDSSADTEDTQGTAPLVEPAIDLVRLFSFGNLEDINRLSKVLSGFYNEHNILYKDPAANRFYLVLHKGAHSPEVFNKVCNILSEYAVSEKYSKATQAYFQEHYVTMLDGNAIQVLSTL